MSSKYKKRQAKTRDLEELKKIHRLSNNNQRYANTQYGYEGRTNRQIYETQKIRSSGNSSQAAERPVQPRKRNQIKKKRKSQFFIGRILFLIVFIVGVIYLIGIVIDTSQKPVISYQTVQRGIIDNSEIFLGLIVRSEEVIENEEEGNMYLIAREGEKVKKDGEVYQILDSIETAKIEQNIKKVESDIEKVQNKRKDMSYYQNEIQAINSNINIHFEEYYMLSKAGNLEKTHELKKQMEQEIFKRQNVHMQDNADSLGALQEQKHDLSSKLRSNQKVYKASLPGWISYYYDDFEGTFTVDTIATISEKDIKQKYTNISTTTHQIITKGLPAYKIIYDEKWYMVCFMTEEWARNFIEGNTYDFMLIEDNNLEFSLKVEQIIEGSKQYKVIFSSREQLDLFLNKRTASFKSTQYIYEGLKIPKSAIAERSLIKIPQDYILDEANGKGVLKLKAESSEYVFTSINVQYVDDKGYAHVLQNLGEKGALQLGDKVSNPAQKDDIYTIDEVSTTQGVYVVNGRITKFKQFDILASNAEYVIVSSNNINGIKQFDQIVTNPKNIEEEQLLKNMDIQNIKN